MVQALVQLDENTNRVLNIVKATYDLKDKGDAIRFVVGDYVARGGPELKPDFIRKMKKAEQEKGIKVKDFAKQYGV